jgi:hypothetical protein
MFGQGHGAAGGMSASSEPFYKFPKALPAGPAAKPIMDRRPIEQAEQNVEASLGDVGAAKSRQLSEVADTRDDARIRQEALVASHQIAEDKTREQLANMRQRLQEKVDAHAQDKIDPDHYWANKGAGARAFATIAMALSNAFGGFSAGFQGREFHPDTTLSDAIDQDIQAQKDNYEAKQKDIDNSQNLYAQNVAAFGDEKAANAAARAEHWTMLDQQIQAISEARGGDVEDANAKHLRALANQKAQEAQAEAAQRYKLITQQSEQKRLETEAKKPPMMAGKPGSAPAGAAPAAAAQHPQYEARPLGKGDEARVMSLPNGSQIWVPVAGDRALIEAGKLTPAQAHAMHVVNNPAGGLALTNKPYTGEASLPVSDKTSPRVAFKQQAAEDLGAAVDQLERMENGNWSPFGAEHQKGSALVGEVRNLLSESGVNPDEYIPKDYNPTEAHTGANAAIPQILRGIVERRKKGIEQVVNRTKGQADVPDQTP